MQNGDVKVFMATTAAKYSCRKNKLNYVTVKLKLINKSTNEI